MRSVVGAGKSNSKCFMGFLKKMIIENDRELVDELEVSFKIEKIIRRN